MADIIRIHGDPHRNAQTLLPWYANGSLDPDEAAALEAHLVECADCRADLKLEQLLSANIANLPADTEQGWTKLRERVQGQAQPTPRLTGRAPSAPKRRVPTAWIITAQAASLAIIAGLGWMVLAQPKAPAYRALGAAPVAADGNMVVVFKPTISEQDLRAALVGDGARIVDGPTAGDAYVLHVAAPKRATALARLRADSRVLLAEPIDSADRP